MRPDFVEGYLKLCVCYFKYDGKESTFNFDVIFEFFL